MRTASLLLIATLATSLGSLSAQTSNEEWQSVYYSDANTLYNPVANISSPLKLLYNSVTDYSVASATYAHTEGEFKPIEQGNKLDAFNIGIEGLTSFDGFFLEGALVYKNTKEFDQQWSTALYTTPTNPFILASSAMGNRITEEFDMYAGAAYQFEKLALGMRLEYETGSLFSHSDPRTENYAMRFRATPAVSYSLSDGFTLGASAKAEIYNSQASHTIVNNFVNYNYYLMMGSGLYYLRSSGDVSGYPREYTGGSYQAALQFILGEQSSRVKNSTEISFEKTTESSQDGSSSLIFQSGEYFATTIAVSNRTTFASGSNMISNLDLNFSLISDEGYWSDQKKVVDTEHGNLTTYEVQMRYKLNSADIMSAGLAYQLALLKGGAPSYLFELSAQYYDRYSYQNDGSEYIEDYSNYTVGFDAKKYLRFGQLSLDISLCGAIKQMMGEPLYSGASNDITQSYTYPRFAYLFSDIVQYGATINASHPIGRSSRVGLKIGGYQYSQMGESTLYEFAGTNQTYINSQIYLNF